LLVRDKLIADGLLGAPGRARAGHVPLLHNGAIAHLAESPILALTMMRIGRFAWILPILVLAPPAPAGSDPLAALPQQQPGTDDEQAAVYATVAWPNPRNPRFVTLGADRYLLSTRTGKQLWRARENSFSPAAGWPVHSAVGTAWARMGAGTLVVATSHDDADRPLHRVVWWDSTAERFGAPLALPAGLLVDDLAPIDADHALVCARVQPSNPGASPGPADPVRFAALIARLHDGALSWETEDSAGLRSALLAADIRGPLAGMEGVEYTPTQPAPPVIFNTRSCRWEMTAPPEALRHVRDLTIKHYRLPDGRTLIGQAHWLDLAPGHPDNLAAPLLWNAATRHWVPIENTAQYGDGPQKFNSYGSHDPVVSVASIDAEFVEFLDPATLHWRRSRQRLPDTPYCCQVAPLGTGAAIVFLAEQGRILLLEPMREPIPGRLVYRHGSTGEARLRGGAVLLLGGGEPWHSSNRPELLAPPFLKSRPIAPLPRQVGYLSGLELKDGTIIAFGGLPPGCDPSSPADRFTNRPAQPSYRYFPREDRWDEVPGLAIHFATGQNWDNGNSGIATRWPRNDALVRRNGDFVYLDSGSTLKPRSGADPPLTTGLVRWRPGLLHGESVLACRRGPSASAA
jgi:hypothetical protein